MGKFESRRCRFGIFREKTRLKNPSPGAKEPKTSFGNNPHGDQYPDNDDSKDVLLQADGHEHAGDGNRHVLIYWLNGEDSDGHRYIQVLQLSGGPGNYAFYHPSVHTQSIHATTANTFYNLGTFTRAQRDEIISIALGTKFEKTSRVNSCRTWTRDILEAMVRVNLIFQNKFEEIDQGIPLKKRVPELAE